MISAIVALAMLMAEPPSAPAAGAPAPAATPPAAATATGAAPVVKVKRDSDMICHSEMVLGSHIPNKVCYTRAEQEDRKQQDQRNLNHMQSGFGKISN